MAAGAGVNWAVTSGQEAGNAPEAMVFPGATEDVDQLDPKNRHPQQKAALRMYPGGGQTPLAQCVPSGRSPSKIQVWT